MTDETVLEEAAAPKKRVRVRDKKVLDIEGGKVVPRVVQEEIVEEPEALDGSQPRIQYNTPEGMAVYEYCGPCADCLNKKPPETTPVFKCVSGKVRADGQIGFQLAAWRRDGHAASPLCKNCYDTWIKAQPNQEARFRVL